MSVDTTTSPSSSPNLPPDLYAFALANARASAEKRELAHISKETSLGYYWLQRFSRGEFPGASYVKVHKLATWYLERDAREAAQQVPQQ